MSLSDQLRNDLTQALKDKDAQKAQVLRMVVSSIKNEQINQKKDSLEDKEILVVLQKEAKKRKDSIEAYEKGGRPELAASEKEELELIANYLPAQLSEEDVRAKVKEIISKAETTDFGPLMGQVMGQLKDQADGKLVQQIVKEELQK